ncbi:hypothetical protein GCM10010345_88710 [Streptomyces canarius]|uniref:Uncharacterized protein n=1 Tax=Streptomyces canarius TaxID=285453 RepID=A0ABQ3DAG8_9ACTN|nr:hypothetical protein GCM10010345_88710 [Streptomyces canarius]
MATEAAVRVPGTARTRSGARQAGGHRARLPGTGVAGERGLWAGTGLLQDLPGGVGVGDRGAAPPLLSCGIRVGAIVLRGIVEASTC